ncbi:MAG: hypothetical protein MCSN_5970 [Candidatus Microsyncoccus archaeolyticus]|jgi:hypothetical protein|nr:MAG: hypothetical protein MCSN_5970 [Candidatus Parcubacteria bacterium]
MAKYKINETLAILLLLPKLSKQYIDQVEINTLIEIYKITTGKDREEIFEIIKKGSWSIEGWLNLYLMLDEPNFKEITFIKINESEASFQQIYNTYKKVPNSSHLKQYFEMRLLNTANTFNENKIIFEDNDIPLSSRYLAFLEMRSLINKNM